MYQITRLEHRWKKLLNRSQLAIIIPAFDEEATISSVIEKAMPFGNVIVVNDGSRDKTGSIARAIGAHVIDNPTNLGYDKSLEAGFLAANKLGFHAAITMDADGEHSPNALESFVHALIDKNIPLILGIRSKKPRLTEEVMGIIVRGRYGVNDIF